MPLQSHSGTRRVASTSLAKRLSALLLIMLFPVAGVGLAGVISLDRVSGSFQTVSREVVDEGSRIVRIREYLSQADEALESMLGANRAQLRPVLDALVAGLDRELVTGVWDEPAERRLVSRLRSKWSEPRHLLMATRSRPADRLESVVDRKHLHADLDRAVVLLNRLEALALQDGEYRAAHVYTGEDRRRQLMLFGFVLAATLLISVLIAVRFRNSILRPLNRLQTAAQRFGADDLGYRVDVDRSDELGEVMVAFNEMADRLSVNTTQLVHAQRMEGIGQLAGGIAHDFNNLLSVIQNYATFVAMDMEPTDPRLDDVQEIQTATAKAVALTRQLLTFSRKDEAVTTRFDPSEEIQAAQRLIAGAVPEDVDVLFSLDETGGEIEMDPSQFDQVLLNLVVNARDAMPRGGKLTVQTSQIYINDDVSSRKLRLDPGRYVVVAVSDTGVGMDADVKERIFEPFFTTKGRASGTGLGLATVYGIVTRAGGSIAVESEVGLGTTFKLFLPAVTEHAGTGTRAAEPAERGSSSGEGSTVLVVEDEEGVRKVVERILTGNGYAVLSAATPDEALAISSSFEGPINLLLTDVIMPGRNGKELAQEVHVSRPEVPVLYMSGYTDSIVSTRGLLQDERLLQKPFTPALLLSEAESAMNVVVHVDSGDENLRSA